MPANTAPAAPAALATHVEVAEDSFGNESDLIGTRWGFGPVAHSGECGECGDCSDCQYSNDQD